MTAPLTPEALDEIERLAMERLFEGSPVILTKAAAIRLVAEVRRLRAALESVRVTCALLHSRDTNGIEDIVDAALTPPGDGGRR